MPEFPDAIDNDIDVVGAFIEADHSKRKMAGRKIGSRITVAAPLPQPPGGVAGREGHKPTSADCGDVELGTYETVRPHRDLERR